MTGAMAGADQSLRSVLGVLERAGELVRVAAPVSPRFELSAMLAAADDGPALLFEQV
ncbi:MAG: UbiD family decarboxylase, partial [Solirubrobacteraceae bacterium]